MFNTTYGNFPFSLSNKSLIYKHIIFLTQVQIILSPIQGCNARAEIRIVKGTPHQIAEARSDQGELYFDQLH